MTSQRLSKSKDGLLGLRRRLTVLLEDPATSALMNSAQSVLTAYDIVAVQPTSDRTFQQACSMLEADLITVDFSRRLPFRLRPQAVKQALQRGLLFEITYSGLVRGGAGRRQLIGQGATLVRTVGAGGVVLSSGALRSGELRGAHDVINLGGLLGLPMPASQAALSEQCRKVLQHGDARRTYKGIFRVISCQVDESDVVDVDMDQV
eukprot:CAMPEP_0196586958 /NCGR_PEP_ID=MMETSP1081-20130531/55984_1 /TAXON_ID=36882 /ORGANISM="Pyramimonas amylifera, Strain CCMP720" /LENGTH=205 /DNA_ID=CAMNT_0041908989 /DNA_START=498 /DNA_END=1115 /DNA_ORIENTATION=+